MAPSLIGFLISLIVLAVVIYAIRLVLPMLNLPAPFPQLIYLILGLIAFFWLLGLVGIGPMPTTRFYSYDSR